MKKLILTLACAMVWCAGSAQITIKLSEVKSDTAYFIIQDNTIRSVLRTDTVVGKKGKFTYTWNGDKACAARITIKDNNSMSYRQVFLVPGEKGTFAGKTLKEAIWNGRGYYGDLASLDAKNAPLDKSMTELLENYQKQMSAGANQDSLRNAVIPKYQELKQQEQASIMEFVKANPKSGVCVTTMLNMQNAEEVLNLIDPSLKTGVFSPFVDYVQGRIDAEKARKEAAKNVVDGAVAPDFTLKDINGNDLSLSSLRGKYLILDFWGSWCGWCIKGIPEMKNYYKKYEGKFEILGVDCNDTEDKWKAAVQKYEIPWKHVFNPRSSDITKKYAIQGYPTKIVIDPDGKIAKTIIGEDPAFYQYLDGLFGGK